MSRMNSRDRKRSYAILKERDGERCRICRRRGNYQTLVIDHIDNDNDNNELWNLQLLCRLDNYFKNPRSLGNQSTLCVSVDEADGPKVTTAEYEKNLRSEPMFRHWIYDFLKKHNEIEHTEAIDSGAEIVQCSQETIKRYLRKMCSKAGILMLVRKNRDQIIVRLRTEPISKTVDS